MRVTVSKIKINRIFILIVLGAGILLCPNSAFSQSMEDSLWDQWLDDAYKLTWHSSNDIDKWLSENEKKIFKEPLLTYVKNREKYILLGQNENESISFPDNFYLRLSIAEMLMYLRTKDIVRLENAVQAMMQKNLQSKMELPEIAFWFHYIQAHLKMEKGDSKGFINHAYKIWLHAILKLEAAQYDFGSPGVSTQLPGFYQSLPFLYRCLANLIIPRAIIEKRLANLDALGSLIWNLSYRMPNDEGYGLWIKQITDRLAGTKSDIFRLTYTVFFMDAESQKLTTEELLVSSKNTKKIEKNLIKAFENYDYLYKIARHQIGQAAVLTQQLNLTSFIVSRLYEADAQRKRIEKIGFLKQKGDQVWHEPKNILSKGISAYDNLAQISIRTGGWEAQGFLDREAYLSVMHGLWQAIMNLCLENGFYYREGINPKAGNNFLNSVPLLEKSVHRYLDFFEKYVAMGDLDIVPNNAYYGAVEASQLLSELYYMSGSWKKGVLGYEKGFHYSLQSVEIFPFDVNSYFLMANQLSQLGRLDLYKKPLIMLTERLKKSQVINKYKNQQNTKYLGRPLGQLQEVIPQIILLAPSSKVLKDGMVKIPKAVIERLEAAKAEITDKKGGFKKGTNDGQRIKNNIILMKGMEKKKKFKPSDVDQIEQSLSDSILILSQYDKEQANSNANAEISLFSIGNILPNQLKTILHELNQIHDEIIILKKLPNYEGIRDVLVSEADNPFHKLIREFYHENSRRDLNYLKLLKGDNLLSNKKN